MVCRVRSESAPVQTLMVLFKKKKKQISRLYRMKMIACRRIALTWSARLLVMDWRLEIVHLRSQIRRPFNGISRDQMFNVD